MSENGMRLLILALIFLVLPILEGVVKRRRKGGVEPTLPEADDPALQDWDRRPDDDHTLQDWDRRPDEDHVGAVQGEPKPVAEAVSSPPTDAVQRMAPAESVHPVDLWEELRALARGQAPPSPILATPEGKPEVPKDPEPWVGYRPAPPKPERKDPRSDPKPAPASLPSPRASDRIPAAAAGVLTQLRGMTAADFRRVVVFREVLGPPVSVRSRDVLDPTVNG